MNNILHLVLKRKWWDMIESGEKKEEYRDVNYLYCSRLLNEYIIGRGWCKLTKERAGDYDSRSGLADGIKSWLRPRMILQDGLLKYKNFDSVCFHLGYTNTTMLFNIEDITIKTGKSEWGAEEGIEYFVIKLGERI